MPRPTTYWHGDLAEYTGQMDDNFHVIEIMEGIYKGKEVLTARGPDGHDPYVERNRQAYEQQQAEFRRLREGPKN